MKSDVILQFAICNLAEFSCNILSKIGGVCYVAIFIIVSLDSLSFMFGNRRSLFQYLIQLDEIGTVLAFLEFNVR